MHHNLILLTYPTNYQEAVFLEMIWKIIHGYFPHQKAQSVI